jgi:chromosome segregation protein
MSAKTMRAERFSDLLFNGGNGQRPAPFAEVSLHFDNSDGAIPIDSKTPMITRRVDRSGKCIYRLNRKRVPRQKIVDLLAKTMSSPGGQNFIMQGDVDKFIKMSPLDRRAIIDDLAGIAEYDEKKEKSLAELQKVETNLQSMGAILNEIGMQMEKLRAEKRSVLRYRELKNQLEEMRATLICAQREICGRRLSKLQRKIDGQEKELRELLRRQERIGGEISQRERELRQLDKLIEEKRSAEILTSAEKLRERINTLTEMIESANGEYAAIEAKIAQTQAEVRKASERTLKGDDQKRLLMKIERVSADFSNLHREFNALLQALSGADRKPLSKTKKVLRQLQGVLQDIHQLIDNFGSYIREVSKLLRRAESRGVEMCEAESELQRLETSIMTLEGQRIQLDRRLGELRRKMQEAQEALKIASQREEDVRGAIRAASEEKERIQQKISSLKSRHARLQGSIRALEEKLQNYRIEKARLQTQLDAIEKGTQRPRAEMRAPTRIDVAKLEREIQSVEAELEALGPINFRAVQDYRNAERRYSSQKKKYDKLVGEKQTILNFMREIDQKKTEVFMKTFEEISENFSKVFSELSPGGTARLILENRERPLEGGLEIEAKPAGKELVRVGAMSGGEKALTALAFIFAIQRSRPTTFYVLDEIDAHLDDENLQRVAEMLRKSSRKSQIIVVTLRDAMMSVADRLFGVTMDSGRVSRLVSVELTGLAA